ncbi:MAG: outer rane lipoprotein carrier protein LolA [Bacteroidetes bacterium]|nr:outer rane lipoprotein carrier protein LolA [Bacteroidota bacterium]
MNTKRIVFSLMIAIAAIISVNAQSNSNAVKVVDNMLQLLKNNAIKTNFEMEVKEPSSAQSHRMKGNFTMKENKFILNTAEMNVYFDGKTQSAYMTSVNEVSITNPTEKELAETNPMAIISSYKRKSAIKFAKSSISKSFHVIELIPKDKNSSFKKIVLNVNKTNNYPLFIELIDKSGMITDLTLTQFKSGLNISDNTFIFNPKKYKDIEINDLR